jgi:hypothetical protein
MASRCPSFSKVGADMATAVYQKAYQKERLENKREAPFLVKGKGILASLAVPPQEEYIASLYQNACVFRSRNRNRQLLFISYRDNLPSSQNSLYRTGNGH